MGENGFHLNGDYKNYGYTQFHYRPFTLEALFGFCDALQEMLLQDHTGEIELFASIPEEWKKREISFKNLRSRGGLLISATAKNGEIVKLTIAAQKPCEATIYGKKYSLKQGENQLI